MSGADQVFRSVGTDGQPVAVIAATQFFTRCGYVPPDQVNAVATAPFDPTHHGRVMLGEQAGIAVNLIDSPRANHPGIAPGRGAGPGPDARTDVRECSVSHLCIIHIDEPLGEECGHVGIVGGGADKHLGIAHPAESLITLRAVSGNAQVIPALTPYNVRI